MLDGYNTTDGAIDNPTTMPMDLQPLLNVKSVHKFNMHLFLYLIDSFARL
jgi:hypothetical protein